MTPEQEEQVARALAETARHEPVPPIPPEVAARLDDVLADLVADRARGGTPAGQERTAEARPGTGVDEVAARRRARRSSWLTAAAAVTLIAAAGAAVATNGFGTTSDSDSSTTSAGGSTTVQPPGPDAARDDAGSQEKAAPESSAPSTSASGAGAPQLRSSTLVADVQRVLREDVTRTEARPAPRRKALTGPPTGTPCATPPTGPGERVLAVRLDGEPATLLLGALRGGSRPARVYSCDDLGDPVASATVPLR